MQNYIIEENKFLDFQLDAANKGQDINSYIKQFGWYLTPFFYEDQYSRIKSLKETNTGTRENVSAILKETFFETRILAIYMEAFYKKLPYIKDFSFLVDHGIVLFLQCDYPGSINVHIPIIEGVLRKYLTTKGIANPSFNALKGAFILMKDDIVDRHRTIYISKGLGAADYNPLLHKYDQYLSVWVSFIEDFIINGMYLDTRAGTAPEFLNRHLILHALSNDIYYNLSNSLKTYIVIQYLTWFVIQITPGFHTVPNIKENEFSERHLIYQQILDLSSSETNQQKSKLYKGHSQFNINTFFK